MNYNFDEGGHLALAIGDIVPRYAPGKSASKCQVRSECLTCIFRVSCCSARLSWAQVPAFAGSPVWDRKKKKGGRDVMSLDFKVKYLNGMLPLSHETMLLACTHLVTTSGAIQ